MCFSLAKNVSESHIHDVPKNNGLIFHMGEVSELWRKTIVINSHIFNFEKLLSSI